MTQNSGPEDGHYMVTGATEGHDMVTGVERESLCQHNMTGVHEEVTYCSPSTYSGKQKKTVLLVNRNSAARTPLRQSKHTKFCRRFSSWQTATILRIFTLTSTEFPSCQSHLRQRCPRSTGNLKSSSCLKICSKRVSKFIIK